MPELGLDAGLFLTVTLQVAVFPPAATVILAFPAFLPETTPPDTVATEPLEVLQETSCVELAGETFAFKVYVAPTYMVIDPEFRLTEVTALRFVPLVAPVFTPTTEPALLV